MPNSQRSTTKTRKSRREVSIETGCCATSCFLCAPGTGCDGGGRCGAISCCHYQERGAIEKIGHQHACDAEQETVLRRYRRQMSRKVDKIKLIPFQAGVF